MKQFIYCSTYNWYDKPVRKDEGLYRRISIQAGDSTYRVYGFQENGQINSGVRSFLSFSTDIGFVILNTRFSPQVSIKDVTRVDDASYEKGDDIGSGIRVIYKTDEHYFQELKWPSYAYSIEKGNLILHNDMGDVERAVIPIKRIVSIIGSKSENNHDYSLAIKMYDSILATK